MPANHQTLLSQLLSPSGYERERALLGIGPQHASAAVWQAVLLRLNDWVPQVRAAAWHAFEKLLPQLDLDTALQLHPRWLSARPFTPLLHPVSP